jgi:hypothetical protein
MLAAVAAALMPSACLAPASQAGSLGTDLIMIIDQHAPRL